MQKLYVFLVLGVLFCSFSDAQTPDFRIQLEQIDKFLSAKYNADTPGCVIGIVKDGNLIYSKGFGMANLDYQIPMTPKSIINIMSVSKQFTAACIALLIIDKKLSLTDDIHKYIPEFPEYSQKITVEHLIRHTSGIRDYNDLVTITGGSAENVAKRSDGFALVIKQKELNFSPGNQYSYTNSGYLLLSYIVERISGMSFEDFAKKRIFEPLEMNQTFFSDEPHQIIKNRVTSYGKDEQGNYFPFNLNDNRMGCAGLFSTIGDLYKWDKNFYDGKVGGEMFIELMLSLKPLNNGKENDYAFGNIIDRHEGFKEINHSGGLLGIRCKLSRFPTEKLSIIYLGNGSQDASNELYSIASLFLINKSLSVTSTTNKPLIALTDKMELPKDEMKRVTGLFRFQEGNLLAQISLNNKGYLEWQIISRNDKMRLYTEAKTEMKLPNGQTIKSFENNPDSLLLITRSGKIIGGRRLKCVSENKLADYTGNYYCEDLQKNLEIKKEDDNLIFHLAGVTVKQPLLVETNQLQFNHPLLGLVTVTFKLNKKNVFLLLSTERTSNLKFVKS